MAEKNKEEILKSNGVFNLKSRIKANEMEEDSMKSIALIISILAFLVTAFNFISINNTDEETVYTMEKVISGER